MTADFDGTMELEQLEGSSVAALTKAERRRVSELITDRLTKLCYEWAHLLKDQKHLSPGFRDGIWLAQYQLQRVIEGLRDKLEED